MKKETIEISLEEYKELLIIKGRYEELSNKTINYPTNPLKIYTTPIKWNITTTPLCYTPYTPNYHTTSGDTGLVS